MKHNNTTITAPRKLPMKLSSDCSRCIFNVLNCMNKICHHYYTKDGIYDRESNLFASEILARPTQNPIDVEEYFTKINIEKNKKLLRHQLSLLLKLQNSGKYFKEKVFLNLDRLLLIDDKIVSNLIYVSKKINKTELILEVTERFGNIDLQLIRTYQNLVLNGILFAADDYDQSNNTHNYIAHYSYVKIDMLSLYKGLNENYNDFIDSLYSFKNSNIKLIAEKVETENDYILAKKLPFDYFQGFYFKEYNFDSNKNSKMKNLNSLSNQLNKLPLKSNLLSP